MSSSSSRRASEGQKSGNAHEPINGEQQGSTSEGRSAFLVPSSPEPDSFSGLPPRSLGAAANVAPRPTSPECEGSNSAAAEARVRRLQEQVAQQQAERIAPAVKAQRERLISESLVETWRCAESGVYGCEHYERKCKLYAKDIDAFVTCRLCYSEALPGMPDLDRFNVDRILCMICKLQQPVSKHCANKSCPASEGDGFASYFCEICKLYDNTGVDVYHCHKCGLCRLGLQSENYHCDTCQACVSIESKDRHHCVERSLHADCPVCKEYMFTSRSEVIYMRCGHTMHSKCWEMYTRSKYTCPVCQKSLTSMSSYYREIDRVMETELANMPAEFKERTSKILCQDCGSQSEAPYHFEYHKCGSTLDNGQPCGSYNTRVI